MNIQKIPESIAYDYFNCWNNQNLEGLRNIFTDDVSLCDWELNELGIENVLKANQNIFNSVDSIHANVTSLMCNNNKVVAELIIDTEGKDEEGGVLLASFEVVDVIEFNNSKNKIKSIKAYRRF